MEYLVEFDNVYKFDTASFCSKQKEIYTKYEVSEISYINNINNYLFHIMEEIWEVKTSVDRDERLEELVDVLMYIGSATNCFKDRDDKVMYMLHREILTISKHRLEEMSDITVNEVCDIILELRREFPERKWHKPYSEENINHVNRSNIVALSFMHMFTCVLGSLIHEYSVDEINAKINYKQDYILSL